MCARLLTPLALALILSACSSDTKPDDPLATDTALAREMGMVMADSLDEPVMTDLSESVGAADTFETTPSPQPSGARTESPSRSGARRTDGSDARRTDASGNAPGETARRPASRRVNERTSNSPSPASTPASPRAATPESAQAATPASAPSTPGRAQVPVASTARGTRSGFIPAGTSIALTSNATICTNTHRVGQRFAATVIDGGGSGQDAGVPAGAQGIVEITDLARGSGGKAPRMRFKVSLLAFGGRTYPVDATVTSASVSRIRDQSASKDAEKVIGGAAVGAVIGQVVGKDTKSTVAGAAAGAVAGAAAAVASVRYEGCVPSGGRINANLNSDLQIRS